MLKICLTGDLIVSNNKFRKDQKLIQLMRSTDLVIGNLETLFHSMKGYPEVYYGQGHPMISDPNNIEVLKNFNIKLVSHANNHTNDYGVIGLMESMQNLEKNTINYSGVGEDYESALKPAVIKISNNKIGLISFTASYNKSGVATPSNIYVKGRPGVNYLELKPNLLTYISKFLRLVNRNKFLNNRLLTFGDYIINKDSYKNIKKSVKEAKQNCDLLFISIHNHRGENNKTLKAIENISKEIIDLGADAIFIHGPHIVKGIGLYKEKPIFFSLGNFFAQLYSIDKFPADFMISKGFDKNHNSVDFNKKILSKVLFKKTEFWESYMPILSYDKKLNLLQIEIVPIELSSDEEDFIQSGTPQIMSEYKCDQFMDRLDKLCKIYGTRIEKENEKFILSRGKK